LAELHLADQVPCRVAERHVQRDDVAFPEHRLERRELNARRPRRRMVRKQNLHAEATRYGRRRLPQRALADDAERRPVEIADRMIEEAELRGLLPPPTVYILPIGNKVAPQGGN